MSPDRALERLKRRFLIPKAPWLGQLRGNHAQVMVPVGMRHLWSPWLTFEVTEHPDGAKLSGRFMPQPTVWTLYIAVYAICGFSALFLTFFGLSQSIAGGSPTALWGLLGCAGLAGALYAMALVGQRLSATQMRAIREWLIGDVFADAVFADAVFADAVFADTGLERPLETARPPAGHGEGGSESDPRH